MICTLLLLVSGPQQIPYLLFLGLSPAGQGSGVGCFSPDYHLPLLFPWSLELPAFAVRDYDPLYLVNKELLLCENCS